MISEAKSMKWKQFRNTSKDFKEADCVIPVDENGAEVNMSSDKLQSQDVIDVRWGDCENGLKLLYVTIRRKK